MFLFGFVVLFVNFKLHLSFNLAPFKFLKPNNNFKFHYLFGQQWNPYNVAKSSNQTSMRGKGKLVMNKGNLSQIYLTSKV
jgi:hypothetical protein